nr:MAG TPA: hypothetical protein [Caudoviricetes sp.]
MLKMGFGYSFGYSCKNEIVLLVIRLVIHFLVFWYSYPPPVWYLKMAFFVFFVELRGVFSTFKGGVWQVFNYTE